MKTLEDFKENCFRYCTRHGTMACPPSIVCMAKDDRPYFELNKNELTLLEKICLHFGLIEMEK